MMLISLKTLKTTLMISSMLPWMITSTVSTKPSKRCLDYQRLLLKDRKQKPKVLKVICLFRQQSMIKQEAVY